MKLRDYQENCVEAVLEAWKEHPSCVVVLPTGCGKTVVFMADDKDVTRSWHAAERSILHTVKNF